MGNLIDLKTRANLTQQRQDQLNVVDFSRLPLDKAIVKVKGDGSRKIAIFTDPDCPYCKRLEQELAKVSNVTVYVFLLPAPATASRCAAQGARGVVRGGPGASLGRVDAGRQGAVRARSRNARTRSPKWRKWPTEVGIQGTPGLVFANGKLVPGAISAEQIEQYLNAAGEVLRSRGSPWRSARSRGGDGGPRGRAFSASRRRAPARGSAGSPTSACCSS